VSTTDPLPRRPPLALHAHAADDLRFIRSAMERASEFTSISGLGQAAAGVTALGAAWLASRQTDPDRWLGVWLGEAAVAIALCVSAAALKAQRLGLPLFGAAGRRFVLAFAAPSVAGLALTAALARTHAYGQLPGAWLLLYGAAVVGGGAFSVPSVPVMGAAIMACGLGALFTPAAWGNAWLAAGFGAAQLVFGLWIARRHDG
jgi:hypothetical protein